MIIIINNIKLEFKKYTNNELKELDNKYFSNKYFDLVDIKKFTIFLEYSMFLNKIDFEFGFLEDNIDEYLNLLEEDNIYYIGQLINTIFFYFKNDLEYFNIIKDRVDEYLYTFNKNNESKLYLYFISNYFKNMFFCENEKKQNIDYKNLFLLDDFIFNFNLS